MSDIATLGRPEQTLSPTMPWWVLPGLALIAEVIFASGLALSFSYGNETQQTTMLTAAIGLSATAFGFFYQSSMSGRKKDETIASLAKANGGSPDQPVAIAINNPESKP